MLSFFAGVLFFCLNERRERDAEGQNWTNCLFLHKHLRNYRDDQALLEGRGEKNFKPHDRLVQVGCRPGGLHGHGKVGARANTARTTSLRVHTPRQRIHTRTTNPAPCTAAAPADTDGTHGKISTPNTQQHPQIDTFMDSHHHQLLLLHLPPHNGLLLPPAPCTPACVGASAPPGTPCCKQHRCMSCP